MNSPLSTLHAPLPSIPPGYKQTDVGVIPEEWEAPVLGDLFTFKNGLNKAKMYFGYGTPIVNYMDVFAKRGILFRDIQGRVSVSKQELKSFDVHKGDVFFTRTSETSAEVGMTTVILDTPKDTVFSGFILRARPKDDGIDDQFKKYCFSTHAVRKQIVSQSTETTRALTNGRYLSAVAIALPPLPEQRAIATALSDVDALIASLDQLIAKKRDLKQAAMQQLLTGQNRLPGFKGEWEVKTLNEVCWFQEGPGVRNTQFTTSGIKLLNGTNIFRGVLNLDTTTRFISEREGRGAYAHFLADEGDIILASSGITIDRLHEKVAFVKAQDLPFCMNTSTIRFKPLAGTLDPSFLYQFLTCNDFKRMIGGVATGSAQLNFGPSHVAKVELSIPPLPEQNAIAEVLSDMDEELSALDQRRAKTCALKQGMMQELLTGRIRLV